MTETIGQYEIELYDSLVIVRHNGETIKAKKFKASDAFQRFNDLVKKLREKLL
tara:strand:+ start:435 stop:593 length:159 start_codon:yes stop_codon:yes gene_type:complete